MDPVTCADGQEVELVTCAHGHVLGIVRAFAGLPRLCLFRQAAQGQGQVHLEHRETAAVIGDRAVLSCSLCLSTVVWRPGAPVRDLTRRSGDPLRLLFPNLEFKVGD